MGVFTRLQNRDRESEFRLTRETENKEKSSDSGHRVIEEAREEPKSVGARVRTCSSFVCGELKKRQFVTERATYSLGDGSRDAVR